MDQDDLLALIAKGESQDIEFKEAFPDQARMMAREIAAFATSNDGIILIGVSDDGQIKGIGDLKEKDLLISRLEGICQNAVRPPITPRVEAVTVSGTCVLVVRVPKGLSALYFVDNIPYVRHLTSARPAEPQEVTELVLAWSGANGKKTDIAEPDFEFARTDYRKTRIPDKENGRQIGFWVGAIPLGISPSISRPALRKGLWPGRTVLKANPDPGGFVFRPIDGTPSPMQLDPEPLQGGAAQMWHKRTPTDGSHARYEDDLVKLVIRADGRISLVAKTSHIEPVQLNMRWVMADIANVIRVIDCIRTAEGKPFRYVLGAELRYDQHTHVDVQPVVTGQWRLTRIEDESGQWGGLLGAEPTFMAPKELAIETDRSAFLGEWLHDLYDLCGAECSIRNFTFII